jgi:hypothetical protein
MLCLLENVHRNIQNKKVSAVIMSYNQKEVFDAVKK